MVPPVVAQPHAAGVETRRQRRKKKHEYKLPSHMKATAREEFGFTTEIVLVKLAVAANKQESIMAE